MLRLQGQPVGFVQPVGLVEDQAGRQVVRPGFAQDGAGHLELRLVGGVRRVDHEQQQRRVERFGQGGPERGDEVVRELLDEPHGVGHQDAGRRFRPQRPHGGVEGREKLVGDQHVAAGERAHERGFAGVRVADQRDPELVPARRAALLVVALDGVELLLQLGAAVPDLATVEVDVGLARPDPALPSTAARRFPQARKDILQAGHLDLQFRLAAPGVTMEDFHDHPGAVEHLRAGRALQVAGLARRNLVVDDDELQPGRAVPVAVGLRGRRPFPGILEPVAGL